MKKIMNPIAMLSLSVAITACSIDQEREISGAYADIKQMQILDPMAPENNTGVVNSLDGNVGQKVIKNYQAASYLPKEGRVVATFEGTSK